MDSFASFDGQRLAWHEVGSGRPVVLLHGLFSTAEVNWLRFGTAAEIAAAGCRVILPDLRAHGASARPHDAASYPADVLARDLAALIAHLGLVEFDLGGYSLGSRAVVRGLVAGLAPRRVVLAGMGLTGLIDAERRSDWFLRVLAEPDSFPRGSPGWTAAAFMRSNHVDPVAVAHLLRVPMSTPAAVLAALARPTLVVAGADDADNGSAADLAAALPAATYVAVAGNHMTSVTKPDLGRAIAAFLGG